MTQPVEEMRCARCKWYGALYDAQFARPEGEVCWLCVSQEEPILDYMEHELEEKAWAAQKDHDDRVKTQEYMVRIDRHITKVFDAGYPTSEITEVIDNLWTHLEKKNLVRKIPQELLEAIENE